MKKRILIILIPVLILIAVIALFSQDPYGLKSKIEVSKEVTLKIKEGTLTNEGATFILKNNTDKVLTYGEDYFIEEKHYNNWYKSKEINEGVFILIGYELKSGDSVEININWKNFYGKLYGNKYRLVKELTVENYTNKIYAAGEFELPEETTN